MYNFFLTPPLDVLLWDVHIRRLLLDVLGLLLKFLDKQYDFFSGSRDSQSRLSVTLCIPFVLLHCSKPLYSFLKVFFFFSFFIHTMIFVIEKFFSYFALFRVFVRFHIVLVQKSLTTSLSTDS